MAESPAPRPSLPEAFHDLEPFIDTWAVQTMAARHQRRLSSTAQERQGFYDAITPRLEDILNYLNDFPLDDLPEDALTLMQLLLSSVEVSLSIEVFDPEKEQLHAKDAARIEISHELDDL